MRLFSRECHDLPFERDELLKMGAHAGVPSPAARDPRLQPLLDRFEMTPRRLRDDCLVCGKDLAYHLQTLACVFSRFAVSRRFDAPFGRPI